MFKKYYSILEGKEYCTYLKNRSILSNLIETATGIYEKCHFCEHKCGINRYETLGRCGISQTCIASHFFHYGEEPMLVPSYTIFFSGCNFSCIYCQNWDISQKNTGLYIKPEKLAAMIDNTYGKVKNINWVGGDPTPHVLYILKVLDNCFSNSPQIWNSNMYCSTETMELLQYIIDIYLTDFKYGNDACAEKLSKIKDYWSVVSRNHQIAYEQSDIIIRHLVLPNHTECC